MTNKDRPLALVKSVNGNLVRGIAHTSVSMNEVAYIILNDPSSKNAKQIRLKAEVIRVLGNEFDMQVFEDTKDVSLGDEIELTKELLSIELGPGLLGGIYDGLGNPLNELAKQDGYFLKRGSYIDTLNKDAYFNFSPYAKIGDTVSAGATLGLVKENMFDHRIMVNFSLLGKFKVISIAETGLYDLKTPIAQIQSLNNEKNIINIFMYQKWPVKIPIKVYEERLLPKKPLMTKVRIVDTFFPVALGGTACIPGPFGSGKTVFQQSVSKFSDADIVIVAACGERAGEVVETLREFPEIQDPKTGRSLMERTIIICNTSSMPVAAREASVYTAITIGEYYRQMGLNALVLADSTSRWAQAIREMSGRLEEIPGEEAFPAYLGSLIAAFYERAGLVKLKDKNFSKTEGSLTLIGTVSPAGGNFEEPVTQSTLQVVGSFLGLTYARSYAKRFPAISPLDSWSKYLDSMEQEIDGVFFQGFVRNIRKVKELYRKGQAIADQMRVVGEEDLSLDEFLIFLKSEFVDAVFLQQDAFNEIDACPSTERTANLFKQVLTILDFSFAFKDKIESKKTFITLTSLFKNLNISHEKSDEYKKYFSSINEILAMFDGANNDTRLTDEKAI